MKWYSIDDDIYGRFTVRCWEVHGEMLRGSW
nr:MAG TPA: hypothetical protein [Caudoviricetes sp.]